MRRFELHRDEDVSGVSGTGVVAEGVAFSDGGPVALRWTSEWPTSVVFHDRGVESLEAVHGHNGRTRIVWLDPDEEAEFYTVDWEDTVDHSRLSDLWE
jgi:hypothetical protein